MLGLGISLTKTTTIGDVVAILTYNLGDLRPQGDVVYYIETPDINETSVQSFACIPYTIPIPKDTQDTFYDPNNEELLTYTTTAISIDRITSLRDSYKFINNGNVSTGYQLVYRDTTISNIQDDEKLVGWYNNVYLDYKDNFKPGFYFFPTTTINVGAVFSTDTELFYDNVDITANNLKVHLVFGVTFLNQYTNLFPSPLEVPLVTPTEQLFSIFPNELLASGLSVQNIAKEVRYNQRYHKYTDYKDEITLEDTLSTNDTNKEFRPTNSVCLSQLNKQIVIQVPQYRFNTKAPAPWRANKNVTMTGEIACLGPYAFEASSGVVYQPFEIEDNYLNFVDTSVSSIYGTVFISIRRFVITKDILDPLFIAALDRTVAQATYTLNSEDGDGTHKLLYFKIKNIRFKSPGYLPSPPLTTSMTESILVPTIQDTLVSNVQSYATLVVGSFNQTSLKSTSQLNPLAISSTTSNTGRLYNITPVGLEGYNLGDIQEFSQVKYETSSGTVSADQKYIGTSFTNPTKQIYYRVKAKIFSWVDGSADTFDNIQIRLVRQETTTGSIIIVESTTLTPEDMELIVRVTNDFADTHYRFDISNTLNYIVSGVNALFVEVKITPRAGFEGQYNSGDIGFIRFDAETELEAQNFPLTPSSPITYTIPTIPTYNS
jgi:hypothetical protein